MYGSKKPEKGLPMCSDNTTSILPESMYSYLFIIPFTFNIEQVCDVLNYGVAAFFPWACLFWFEKAHKDSADVL
jgi:hypothetical protein